MRSDIEVVRSKLLPSAPSTKGIDRYTAFDLQGLFVSESHLAQSVVSDWHHHADRTLLGRVVAGRLNFDFGPGGTRTVQLGAGDFFRVPARLVHRDVNPSSEDETVVVGILLGDGPTTVNLPGPSAE